MTAAIDSIGTNPVTNRLTLGISKPREVPHATPVHRHRDPGRDQPGPVAAFAAALPGARWIDPENLPHHPALHRRHRRAHGATTSTRFSARRRQRASAQHHHRRARQLRRRKAPRGLRPHLRQRRAERAAGGAGAAPAPGRPAAGDPQVHAACDPRAAEATPRPSMWRITSRLRGHFPKLTFTAPIASCSIPRAPRSAAVPMWSRPPIP